jgi:hypothetical protein
MGMVATDCKGSTTGTDKTADSSERRISIPVMNYAELRSLPRVANGFTSDIVIVSLFEAFRRLSILGQLPIWAC